ncbi:MAG: hypothetical protein ACO3XN_09595, partial [Chthoniobacterales bacterium]
TFGGVIMACANWGGGHDAAIDFGDDEEKAEDGSAEQDNENAPKPSRSRSKTKASRKADAGRQKQEELPLDQAMRGRFKDLDPTMVDGQDLDVPTFIRMRIRLQ